MTIFGNRISQDALSEAVAQAVQLEKARLDELDPALVDQVSGGIVSSTTVPTVGGGTVTIGMIPPTIPDTDAVRL